jgi:GT2 family glycosyltransferase
MLLSIIIINYNTKKLTLECLESIFIFLGKKISFEVIVVDNDSHDGSQEALRKFGKDKDNVHIVESDTNLGTSKGNNIGIKKALGQQILVLNSDTYLIDDSIIQAVSYLQNKPDVFGCGCTLLNADGSIGISYGRFPELAVVFLETITWRFGRYRAIIPKHPSDIFSIDFPCGAFFLIRRDLLEKIGLLDENLFMYYEETDLAKRAKKAGYDIVHFGQARVVHLQGQSSGGGRENTIKKPYIPNSAPIDLDVIHYQSWKYYLKKHCSTPSIILIRLLLSLYFKVNYFIFCLLRRRKAQLHYTGKIHALQTGWKTLASITADLPYKG